MVRTNALFLSLALTAAAVAQSQRFEFELIDDATSRQGSISLTLPGTGSLVGDWDAVLNPTGTRTKPGESGPFGPGENVPVPAGLTLSHDGDIACTVSGRFAFIADFDQERAFIHRMRLDLLSTPVAVPVTVLADHDAFRTRSPDGAFPASPASSAEQSFARVVEFAFYPRSSSEGTLEQIAPGTSQFSVRVGGVIDGAIELDGNRIDLPVIPAEILFTGEIAVDGESASITGSTTWSVLGSSVTGSTWAGPIELAIPGGAGAEAALIASAQVDMSRIEAEVAVSGLEAEVLPPCLADCDGDLQLTIFDFLCFQSEWIFGEPRADCDGDGQYTVFDFLCFLNVFDTGCR